MGYSAAVIKVMLASPSDVSQERRIARDILHEWNAVHAEDRRTVLMPIGWESHSFPEMGDRAQAIINKQVLNDCDLLVAIFWTRLGTPTGAAPSGTVEEIEEHLATGKPTLIYFSSAPVRLDSVDQDQYDALVAFKASCQQRGLIEEYDDLAAFGEKFSRHLAHVVIHKFSSLSTDDEVIDGQRPGGPAMSEAARELLLEAAGDRNGTIVKLETMAGTRVQANGREFIQRADARSEAKWRGVVEELQRLGLIEDRAGMGELYFLTDSGYSAVDLLGGTAISN